MVSDTVLSWGNVAQLMVARVERREVNSSWNSSTNGIRSVEHVYYVITGVVVLVSDKCLNSYYFSSIWENVCGMRKLAYCFAPYTAATAVDNWAPKNHLIRRICLLWISLKHCKLCLALFFLDCILYEQKYGIDCSAF